MRPEPRPTFLCSIRDRVFMQIAPACDMPKSEQFTLIELFYLDRVPFLMASSHVKMTDQGHALPTAPRG